MLLNTIISYIEDKGIPKSASFSKTIDNLIITFANQENKIGKINQIKK